MTQVRRRSRPSRLLDQYQAITRPRGSTFGRAPRTRSALTARALSVARRLLVERYREEFGVLYRQAIAELEKDYPHLVSRRKP